MNPKRENFDRSREALARYPAEYQAKLAKAFDDAAVFLLERVKNDGWTWSDNCVREIARCKGHVKFTNTISPAMYYSVGMRNAAFKSRFDFWKDNLDWLSLMQ